MMTLVDQVTTALNSTGWDMATHGNTAAAEAYWAAAELVAAVFKEATDGN